MTDERRRSLAKRALALSVGIALSLVLGEVLVRMLPERVVGFGYEDGYFTTPWEFDRDPVRNGMGFHDARPSRGKQDVRRILLLGDSYVAALSVEVPETVGQRLQHHLNERSEERFEVISAGHEDIGQSLELAALKQLGPMLEPELVLTLLLPLNDVRNNSRTLQALGVAQLSRMDRPRPGWTHIPREDALLLFVEGSALNRLVSFWLTKALSNGARTSIPIDYFVYAEEEDPDWEQAWKTTEQLILQMRDFSESIGARFGLISASTPQGVLGREEGLEALLKAYPRMRERAWDLDEPNRRLAGFCEESGIPFLALEPVFRRLYAEERLSLHWRYDGHWNVAGNDHAGREMAEFVSSGEFGNLSD